MEEIEKLEDVLASLKRGLAQSADGDTHDLGSFAQYTDEGEGNPSGAEVGAAFTAWASKNEIGPVPLDWAWFGEIVRWSGAPYEVVTSGPSSVATEK